MADVPLPEPAYTLPFPDDDELAFSAHQMQAYAAAVSAERDAEIAALREDALRYRWLRDVAWHKGALLGLIERYGPFEWDDAIDEARGEI